VERDSANLLAYLQIVESFRNEEGKMRQRVIANLGRPTSGS